MELLWMEEKQRLESNFCEVQFTCLHSTLCTPLCVPACVHDSTLTLIIFHLGKQCNPSTARQKKSGPKSRTLNQWYSMLCSPSRFIDLQWHVLCVRDCMCPPLWSTDLADKYELYAVKVRFFRSKMSAKYQCKFVIFLFPLLSYLFQQLKFW